MVLPAEFEYLGHEVVIATVLVAGRWRWSYEIDTGLPTSTVSGDCEDETAALIAATEDAKQRIDGMVQSSRRQ